MSDKTIINHRYQLIQKLGQGGMGIVYRAHDRLTKQLVALKYVTASQSDLNFSNSSHSGDFLVALADEFRILATLRHPNIISVLDYGFDVETNHPYYTMEYIESAQTLQQAGRGKSINEKVALLVQVLQALIYLHRRGIIHRDLKPDNILVQADGTVKVLDFGLATRADRQRDSTEDHRVVGTLAYIAPEALRNGIFNQQTDLYSFGMVAYELLNDKHPFAGQGYQELIHSALNVIPDVSHLDVPEPLTMVLSRLLSKDPEDRFQDARDILKIYADYTQQASLYEAVAVRESFLQGAEFVGREAELATIMHYLDVTQEGSGNIILVGGESGVGKSRLLTEIRTQALVRGVQVVIAHAIKEGGTPFYLWEDIFKRVMLLVATTPNTENLRHASVLKPIVPDIGTLYEPPLNISDPPFLEPNAARERLIETVDTLLDRLSIAGISLLICLEDLHWLSSESLNLLQHLQDELVSLPVLIIGSYRDDERPHLPQELPKAIHISLKRMSLPEIAELSTGILGEQIAKPHLIAMLHQVTAGNAYFLLEMIRNLAEEWGSLDNINPETSLSQRILGGGIQNIIRHRLSKLSLENYRLLKLAAVIGREIKIDVMNHFSDDIASWVLACADIAVLEWFEDSWRFSHDKFRDYILKAFTPDDLRETHGHVAEAIEATGVQGNEALLAYHWGMNGNTAKEQEYSLLAGEQAVRNSAGKEAIEYLKRVVEIGGLSYQQNARVNFQLAHAYYSIGNLQLSLNHSYQALADLKLAIPQHTRGIIRSIVSLFFQQFFPILRRLAGYHKHDKSDLSSAVQIGIHMGQVLFFAGKRLETVQIALRSATLAECIGTSSEMLRAYSIVSYMYVTIAQYRFAERYSKKTTAIADSVEDPSARAFTYLVLGVYWGSIGKLSNAQTSLNMAFRLFEEVGDHRRKREALAMHSLITSLAGDFIEAKRLRLQLKDISLRSNDIQSIGWSYSNLAEVGVFLGDYEFAIHHAQKRIDIIPQFPDNLDASTTAYSILAMAYWRNGQIDLATEGAIRAIEHIRGLPDKRGLYTVLGYGMLAELMQSIWATHPSPTTREQFRPYADEALDMFKESTSILVTGKAWYWRLVGMRYWLLGERRKAKTWWEKALSMATASQMRYEEAVVRSLIAQYIIDNRVERRNTLEAVYQIFKELGVKYDEMRVKNLLTTS